jgi:hypothetical protein
LISAEDADGEREPAEHLLGGVGRRQQRPRRPRYDPGLHDALGDHEHRRDRDHARVAEAGGELTRRRDPEDPGEDQRDE